ncbi:putative MFS monocarboxylate transporter [Aureobasidium pullulans]|uniref:Putative MFS monocarboxylate transporter n=1 Tax=Aureobasidium pullulans TaxID=5580 RepID=A0A4S9L0C5_AURPU|nr:putative MFS monocarboxylate transporter [Aureobasidium pullulans]
MAVGKMAETLQAPLSTDTAPSSSAPKKSDHSPDVSKLHDPEAATLEKSVSTEPLQPEPPFPEGGLQAWLVVFGAWAGLFAGLGITNTIAVFQSYVSTHQLADYSESSIGWIFSLYTFLAFFCGIYIGPIFDKYGPRWLIAAGVVCVVAAQMLFSICTEYWHFILVFGVLNGTGCSLLFTPCLASVGHFFRERRGFATGIASAGGSIGGIVAPLMLNSLFSNPSLGWGWGIRIYGFLCLGLLSLALIFVRSRLPPKENASIHPDPKIFKQKPFLYTTIAVFLMEFALFIPIGYISSYARAQGFSESFSFYILTIMNAGSFFGRVLPGWYADRIGAFNTNTIAVFLSIIACFVIWLPFGHTKPGIIVFAIVIGIAGGTNISITPVCISRLCPTESYGRYYATCFSVVSIACLIGIPIGGSIISACDGDYWALILFTSILYVLSFVMFLIAKSASVGWRLLAVY